MPMGDFDFFYRVKLITWEVSITNCGDFGGNGDFSRKYGRPYGITTIDLKDYAFPYDKVFI